MKKITMWLVLFCMILTILPCFSAHAVDMTDAKQDVFHIDDSGCIIVTIEIANTRATGSKTASKSYTRQNANGDNLWCAKVTGTFTYTGTSSTCTASSCSVTIYNNAWYTKSRSASKSGNTATANVTMGLKYLGITIDEESRTVNLTCDKNGNLS